MAPPQKPLPYLSRSPQTILDLTELGKVTAAADLRRQEAFDKSRRLNVALIHARASLETQNVVSTENSNSNDFETNLSKLVESLAQENLRVPREANLSSRIEDYSRYKSFQYFLESGTLLPPSRCSYATDEEYLGGAVIGLAHDLARYAVGRATIRDIESVETSASLVRNLQDVLLEFNFRNGPLRRKFDGTKYALKNLETILYELSITSIKEPETKRSRIEPTTADALVPKEEIDALRQRLEHRDDLREQLIKKCRDGQKAAKQAIFALHRGDAKRATSLLNTCEACLKDQLWPIVQEEPFLRQGSFTAVLEEYVEAKLFHVWLHGFPKDNNDDNSANDGDDDGDTKGKIMLPNQFFMKLEPEEYVGGLCDLTGEIGRFAVKMGTKRDSNGVRYCLETNLSILLAIQSMDRLPAGAGKKLDTLRRSIEKLERMLYEMSLAEATGGRNITTFHEDVEMDQDKD